MKLTIQTNTSLLFISLKLKQVHYLCENYKLINEKSNWIKAYGFLNK